MRKIVYLIEQPLDERNYDRFGIRAWIDRGWAVEILDLTPWAHPRVWQNFLGSGRQLVNFSGYSPLASRSELRHKCFNLEKIGHFIDLTGDNHCTIQAKLLLVWMGAKRVIQADGSIPVPDDSQSRGLLPRLGKAFGQGTIKAAGWMLEASLRKLIAPVIRPSMVIVSGKASLKAANKSGYDHEILKAHSLDYDIYLYLARSSPAPAGNYAVFIDQNLCFHSDAIYSGIPFFATPERYFPSIRNGLRTIASALNVDIRIAGHPRTSIQQAGIDYFGEIPIGYGKTAELIRNCSFVVCHYSTSLQLAVLFGKPIVFVITEEFLSSFGEKYVAKFASVFGKSVINLDHELTNVNWKQELRVDYEKYAEYKNNYIKIDGSPELPHWDIVIDHIEKSEGPVPAGISNR